jgi:hypothetical protein
VPIAARGFGGFALGDEVSVFKVGGKMFAACRLDERAGNE